MLTKLFPKSSMESSNTLFDLLGTLKDDLREELKQVKVEVARNGMAIQSTHDLINQLPVDRLLRDIGIIRQRIRDLKDGGTLDEE